MLMLEIRKVIERNLTTITKDMAAETLISNSLAKRRDTLVSTLR